MNRDPYDLADHAVQSRFSDPRRFAHLLTSLPVEPPGLSEVARNVIVHYRASEQVLPKATRADINLRWITRLLATDQDRHRSALTEPREISTRAQGCCRDHSLFCVSALRAQGIPARSRVGFAGYFDDGFHHDHVIVQAWENGRWRLFDPELTEPIVGVQDPMDMTWSPANGKGFTSAAHTWLAFRRGEVDAETFGVDASLPLLRGARFLFNEVIIEIAHRFGDELLLWDIWGRMGEPGSPVSDADAVWLDEVAMLLSAADDDLDAEHRALVRYRTDSGLHPGEVITQASPWSSELLPVSLADGP